MTLNKETKKQESLVKKVMNTKVAVTKIGKLLKRSASAYYEVGVELAIVKDAINTFSDEVEIAIAKKQYKAFLEELPFEKGVANKLIQIANDDEIGNNLDIMPIAYNTMYSLLGFTADDFAKFREEGLNSFSTAKEVGAIKDKLFGASSNEMDADTQNLIDNLPANKKKKEKEGYDFSNIKVEDDEVEEVASDTNVSEEVTSNTIELIEVDTKPSTINISIAEDYLTAFEKVKLNDLIAKIEKMKFTAEKGVIVEMDINPNVLSTKSPDTQVA